MAVEEKAIPQHEYELMLSALLGMSRTELAARRPELTEEQRARLATWVARRQKGEPLQYILGRAPFRYLELSVAPGVLIPRPETETLVQLVLEWLKTSASGRPQVLDIGTGSGAIALALAQEVGALVVATDVSAEALSQARANAQASGLAEQVEFVQTDVAEALEPRLDGRFDVVVSNPPYIAQGQMPELPTEVRDFEPRAALESGADGLDLFRRIMPAAARLLKPGGLLAVELQDTNIHAAAALLEAADPAAGPTWSHIRIHPDLNHLDRFLTVQLLHQAATQG